MTSKKHVDKNHFWGDGGHDHRPKMDFLLMARPKAAIPYVQQKISLPATLMARFSRLHWDPVHNKVRYGAVSDVATKLLTNYVNALEGTPSDATPLPSNPDLESL